MFSEDAPLVGSECGGVEVHLAFVQNEVFRDAASEIPVFVRTYSDDSGSLTTMAPVFAVFVEEVNSVVGKRGKIKRKTYNRQGLQLFMQRFTKV